MQLLSPLAAPTPGMCVWSVRVRVQRGHLVFSCVFRGTVKVGACLISAAVLSMRLGPSFCTSLSASKYLAPLWLEIGSYSVPLNEKAWERLVEVLMKPVGSVLTQT